MRFTPSTKVDSLVEWLVREEILSQMNDHVRKSIFRDRHNFQIGGHVMKWAGKKSDARVFDETSTTDYRLQATDYKGRENSTEGWVSLSILIDPVQPISLSLLNYFPIYQRRPRARGLFTLEIIQCSRFPVKMARIMRHHTMRFQNRAESPCDPRDSGSE